ncbi:MAG: GNAT family N-acetyltransferase [Candidatus Falkowbacteria bacterium]
MLIFFWANTRPDYQGKGIQTKLINDLIKRIKKMRKPKVKMILISTRIPAFFKKFGFKITTSKYDKDYVLMEKRLR